MKRSNLPDLLRTALYLFLIGVAWLTVQVVALWYFKIVFKTAASSHLMTILIVSSAAALVGFILVIFRKRKVKP